MSEARFFFRVIEAPDGMWVCRRGRHDIDTHPDAAGALAHLRALAGHEPAGAALYLHHLDGRVVLLPVSG